MSTAFAQNKSQPEIQVNKKDVDWTLRTIGLIAALISIAAYVYFYRQGLSLAYKDSISHLQIAERVVHSPTAGFAQLGGVWLPLPHLLSLPLIWIEPFYYSGFAGTIVSMVSYVVASVYLYKIIFGLTKTRLPAIAGTIVFSLNPNILYMQSTPMTELLLFATITVMIYYVQQWIQSERYVHLFAAAFAATLGCMTRYEAWAITAVLSAVVLYVSLKRYGYRKTEGTFLGFVFLGWAGIIGWAGWNWLILGNPLNFQTGEYSKPSLWVGADEPSVGDWGVAAKTYWYAVVENLGITLILLATVGTIGLISRRKLDVLPILSLLIMVPFFVGALEQGQRPLHVMQVSGDLYNVRFGLFAVLLAAVAIGYLAHIVQSNLWAAGVGIAAIIATAMIIPQGIEDIVTVREPVAYIEKGSNAPLTPTSNFLHDNYRGGKILMESFGNETILFDANVSLGENIYEGSYKLWEPALEDPVGSNVKWIIMRHGDSPDKVYQALNGTSAMDDYTLVYQNDTYFIYERK